ncbi:hypothetical protein Tco_1205867, partial [Tanacetum coccineum]
NRQIAQPGMNLGQDNQMQMVRGNEGNQFRQYTGQNNGNGNVVAAQIAQPGMNLGQDNQIQMVRGNEGNQFRQYTGQNVRNQNRNGNVVAAQVECWELKSFYKIMLLKDLILLVVIVSTASYSSYC